MGGDPTLCTIEPFSEKRSQKTRFKLGLFSKHLGSKKNENHKRNEKNRWNRPFREIEVEMQKKLEWMRLDSIEASKLYT